ncbi:hypothetical protein [Micromonospora carbonacea]|uniref:Uncharacterized protein n=1 Tax=Micromonospora carbonacea TaxID=47853 RepID=A0A1C5ACW3_9ACTN|nr:hypothetical protein [Micromonospora carbonacea]SCF42911.1 hypothetical protein GA0070563_112154 [Micromonospora carbonacea]
MNDNVRRLPQRAISPEVVDWTCDTCRQPIVGGGAIHIDLRQVRETERRIDEWNRGEGRPGLARVSVVQMLLAPRREHWRVDCNACCHSCVTCYTIDLTRCQTLRDLVGWTAHLYGKNWFNATDWVYFMQRVTGAEAAA